MDVDEELIEKSNFLGIAKDLSKNQKYLEEIARLKYEGRYRIIMDREGLEPYLIRYYYLNLRPFARITIHHVLKSDPDEALHDHPWPFENYIFSGGYWENTVSGRFWRPAGYSASRSQDFLHRLELDPEKAGQDTFTLFLMGPKVKDWGFISENGVWIQWQEYLEGKRK